jgi:AraC-like DNA-binding protein
MDLNPNAIDARLERFNDADAHAAALHGWDQEYVQVGCGRFSSTVKQASVDDIHVFHESANARIVQRGRLPPARTIVGIPLTGKGSFTFRRSLLGPGRLVCCSDGKEFDLHAPDDMLLIGVVIAPAMLQNIAETAGFDASSFSRQMDVLEVPKPALSRTGLRIATTLECALQTGATGNSAQSRELAGEIEDALADLFTYHVAHDKSRELTHACHADIVRRCHDYVLASGDESIDIQSLSATLGVSRRTIQNSFRAVTQTSPLVYLRAVRLAQVRRLLTSTPADALSISDAAGRWGFQHLGHFAQSYKAQFGELPSHTPRLSEMARRSH